MEWNSDDDFLSGLRQAIGDAGRPISAPQYNQFRRKTSFPDSLILIRRFGSWSRVLKVAMAGVEDAGSEERQFRDWSQEDVLKAISIWIGSKPERLDRYTYRRQQKLDRTGRMPDVQIVSDVLDGDFELVITLAKSWATALKQGKKTSWNFERERTRLLAASLDETQSNSRSIDDAVTRLRTMRGGGLDL